MSADTLINQLQATFGARLEVQTPVTELFFYRDRGGRSCVRATCGKCAVWVRTVQPTRTRSLLFAGLLYAIVVADFRDRVIKHPDAADRMRSVLTTFEADFPYVEVTEVRL